MTKTVLNESKDCSKCMSYGWWPTGDLVPIGRQDARDWGRNVIRCPWCNGGFDMNDDRYRYLLELKQQEEKEGKDEK